MNREYSGKHAFCKISSNKFAMNFKFNENPVLLRDSSLESDKANKQHCLIRGMGYTLQLLEELKNNFAVRYSVSWNTTK